MRVLFDCAKYLAILWSDVIEHQVQAAKIEVSGVTIITAFESWLAVF